MAECEYASGCPFFTGKIASDLPEFTENIRKQYCFGSNASCARYMIAKALGKSAIPIDLIPNQLEKAKDILIKSKVIVWYYNETPDNF